MTGQALSLPLPLAVLAALLAPPLTLAPPLLFSSLPLTAAAALSPLVELAFRSAGAAFAASRRSRSGVRLFTCRAAALSSAAADAASEEPFPEDELWARFDAFSECRNSAPLPPPS